MAILSLVGLAASLQPARHPDEGFRLGSRSFVREFIHPTCATLSAGAIVERPQYLFSEPAELINLPRILAPIPLEGSLHGFDAAGTLSRSR
jgi:hypothetical protein